MKYTTQQLAENKRLATQFGLLKTNCRAMAIIDIKTAKIICPSLDMDFIKTSKVIKMHAWWTGKGIKMMYIRGE